MMRMRLHLASPIDADAVDHLSRTFDLSTSVDQEGLDSALDEAHVLGVRSGVQVSGDVVRRAKNLTLIVRAGSGLDNIDLDAVRDRGARLVRVPGPGSQAVAEFTLGLILASMRNIATGDRSMRAGQWLKYELAGSLAEGKQLGVVGVGAIGSRVARLGAAVGFRVAGCVRPMDHSRRAHLEAQGIEPVDLFQLLPLSDVVTLHVPLEEATREMVDQEFLARMRPGSFLVNTSRGGVVDEAALASALASGHLAGAALDVHDVEGGGRAPLLAKFENVILTPHIGAMARDSQARIGLRVIELITAHFAGELDQVATPEELVI